MFAVDSGASLHMLSKKDLSSDEMDSLRWSKNHTTVVTANGECKQTRKHKKMITILIYSWRCNYSMKWQQFYRLESFAQNTDIHMSGLTVKNHIWPKMGILLLAKRIIVYLLSYQDCQHLPATGRLPHRDKMISQIILANRDPHQIQWRLDVTSQLRETDAERPWQACRGDRMNKEDPMQGIPEWLQPFTENLEDLETHVPAHISERESSDSEGSTKIVTQKSRKHSIYTHFPKDRNCDVCRRTKITRSPTRIYFASRKIRWLDNSRSQNPQWGSWISEQSSTRCRGTRSGHSMDTILSLSNQHFARDGEKFTPVFRTVHTSSIRNKWDCRTSCTTSKRRIISSIIAIWIQMRSGGQIPWNAIATRRHSWQTGKLHMKEDFWESFKGLFFHLVH